MTPPLFSGRLSSTHCVLYAPTHWQFNIQETYNRHPKSSHFYTSILSLAQSAPYPVDVKFPLHKIQKYPIYFLLQLLDLYKVQIQFHGVKVWNFHQSKGFQALIFLKHLKHHGTNVPYQIPSFDKI